LKSASGESFQRGLLLLDRNPSSALSLPPVKGYFSQVPVGPDRFRVLVQPFAGLPRRNQAWAGVSFRRFLSEFVRKYRPPSENSGLKVDFRGPQTSRESRSSGDKGQPGGGKRSGSSLLRPSSVRLPPGRRVRSRQAADGSRCRRKPEPPPANLHSPKGLPLHKARSAG